MKRDRQLDLRPSEVRRLYEVFARYPASAGAMEACPCCVKKAEIAALFSAPLDELPRESFGSYSWKAMTTWGEVEEWKHFLPRLLELSAQSDGPGLLGIDWIGNKFSYVDWREWPEDEVEAMRDFWQHTLLALARSGDWDFASDWLEELTQLNENADAGLEKWLNDATLDEILAIDAWARQWQHLDSPLSSWLRQPEIETLLLSRL